MSTDKQTYAAGYMIPSDRVKSDSKQADTSNQGTITGSDPKFPAEYVALNEASKKEKDGPKKVAPVGSEPGSTSTSSNKESKFPEPYVVLNEQSKKEKHGRGEPAPTATKGQGRNSKL